MSCYLDAHDLGPSTWNVVPVRIWDNDIAGRHNFTSIVLLAARKTLNDAPTTGASGETAFSSMPILDDDRFARVTVLVLVILSTNLGR
jgi:hypothetical protein